MLKCLVKIGVLTPVQQSQYGIAVFIIPKKEGTMRFIIDHHMLNQKMVRNPHPLPRIGKTIKYMVGFQYATTLYISTGYYSIRISPASQDTATIVTEFGKLR